MSEHFFFVTFGRFWTDVPYIDTTADSSHHLLIMDYKTPLFSIITVTYNASTTLDRTMQSVAVQSCDRYEHIIMDGVSTDDTVTIARKYADSRTRIVSQPDAGLYDAMNNAMDIASGEYLIFLNAGDKFHDAGVLQRLAEAVEANCRPGIVYGQTNLVDDEGRYIGPRHLKAPRKLTVNSFKKGMLVCHQAMAVRRDIAPLYDTRWRFSADYDWCIVCLQRSPKNVYVDCTLIDYLYEGMTTRNHGASLRERFRIMARHYGLVPTMLRHLGFALRGFGRKLANPRSRQ